MKKKIHSSKKLEILKENRIQRLEKELLDDELKGYDHYVFINQSRRAQVQSMEPQAGLQIVKAHVPLAETFQYATILRSNTTGRASFTQELDHYAPAPNKDK